MRSWQQPEHIDELPEVFARKIMIVSADAEEQQLLKEQLLKVLVQGGDSGFETHDSGTEAGEAFALASLSYRLLVVDIHVPFLSIKNHNGRPLAIGEGGLFFISRYVHRTLSPPPPILLVSRFNDCDDRILSDKWGSGLRTAFVSFGRICPETLSRAFRQLGIPVRHESQSRTAPSAGELASQGAGSSCSTLDGLSSRVKAIRAASEDERAERLWDLVECIHRDLDDDKVRTAHLRTFDDIKKVVKYWPILAHYISESSKDRTSNWKIAWFYMLQAELLWTVRPVEALYAFMRAISANLEASGEPLGAPGQLIHCSAARIYRDSLYLTARKSWWRRGSRWLTHLLFGGDTLQYLLRTQVARAAERVLRSESRLTRRGETEAPAVVVDLETQLMQLSGKFDDAGLRRIAEELNARSLEMRKYRLKLLRRFDQRLERWAYSGLQIICDFGNQPTRLLIACASIILAFSFFYVFDSYNWLGIGHCLTYKDVIPNGSSFITHVLGAVYFSAVNFITLGDGTVRPDHWPALIVIACNGIFGFVILGLFVSVATSRLRPR